MHWVGRVKLAWETVGRTFQIINWLNVQIVDYYLQKSSAKVNISTDLQGIAEITL